MAGRKKRIAFTDKVFTPTPVQAVTLLNWQEGIESLPKFRKALVDELVRLSFGAETIDLPCNFANCIGDMGRIIDSIYAAEAPTASTLDHAFRVCDSILDTDVANMNMTVADMLQNWKRLNPTSQFVIIVMAYNALANCRSGIGIPGIHISVSGAVGLAALFGVGTER